MNLPPKDLNEWDYYHEADPGTLCWLWDGDGRNANASLWFYTDTRDEGWTHWAADWDGCAEEDGGQANTIDEAIAAVRECLRRAGSTE